MSHEDMMVNEISEDFSFYNTDDALIYYSDNESIDSDGDSSINSHFADIHFSISDDIWSDIFDSEQASYVEDNLITGKYVIGLPGYLRNTNEWLYLSGVTPRSFFRFNFDDVSKYLQEFSLSYVHNPNIHIMALDIKDDGTCTVVIKTFWLKIIQRKWKKVYKERQEYVRQMSRRVNMYARELGKRIRCPGLEGMLTY